MSSNRRSKNRSSSRRSNNHVDDDDDVNKKKNIPTQSAFGRPYEERWTNAQVEECIDLFDLTGEQTSQLLELKDRVADLNEFWGNGPFELVRFVLEHTCYGNVDTMEKRVRKCIEWRNQNGLDTILETYTPPNLIYRFPAAIMKGTDRDGDVLVVARQGDPLGLLQRFGRDELIQSLFWGNEFTVRGPWQRPYRRRRATAILDLKGLGRRHYHPSLILLVQKLGFGIQTHYPYLIKRVILINAPTIFRFVWTIFKPFILAHLRELMVVATESESQQVMEQYVDLKELPEVLVPGIGQGHPVKGLNPHWDCGTLLPPPTPKDWDRPPLVYGPKEDESRSYYYDDNNNHNKYKLDQDSYCTGTMTASSSLASDSGHPRYDNNNNNNNNSQNRHGRHVRGPAVVTTSTKVLMKGKWTENKDKTTAVWLFNF